MSKNLVLNSLFPLLHLGWNFVWTVRKVSPMERFCVSCYRAVGYWLWPLQEIFLIDKKERRRRRRKKSGIQENVQVRYSNSLTTKASVTLCWKPRMFCQEYLVSPSLKNVVFIFTFALIYFLREVLYVFLFYVLKTFNVRIRLHILTLPTVNYHWGKAQCNLN